MSVPNFSYVFLLFDNLEVYLKLFKILFFVWNVRYIKIHMFWMIMKHFTFTYKNTRCIIAKLNKPWVEFVRDTVVSTCLITAGPCCSSLPFRIIIWTAVNGPDFKSIVVYLLKRRHTFIFSLLYFTQDVRGESLVRRMSVLYFFLRFLLFVLEFLSLFKVNNLEA